MQTKDKISLIFTGLLVACALVMTSLLVKRQFFQSAPQPQKRQVQNWQQLKLHGVRTGPADAPVQIVEFFDYQCPFCKQAQPAVEAIRKKYPQRVSVVHENFPLQMHTHAFGAAIAAECARRINPDKFMAYHDGLFAHQNKLGTISFYDSLAARTNIANQPAFEKCVAAQKTAHIVNASKLLGKKLGVSGIPTFLINGTLVSGALPKKQLDGMVKDALAEARK